MSDLSNTFTLVIRKNYVPSENYPYLIVRMGGFLQHTHTDSRKGVCVICTNSLNL